MMFKPSQTNLSKPLNVTLNSILWRDPHGKENLRKSEPMLNLQSSQGTEAEPNRQDQPPEEGRV